MRKFFLVVVLFFLSFSPRITHALPVSYFSQVNFGFSYINSNGLNRVTQGIDAGYVTSLGNIHFPMSLGAVMGVGFGRSRIGVEGAYEFSNNSSYTAIYEVTEDFSYSSQSIGVKYQYEFFRTERWSFYYAVSLGMLFASASMLTTPQIEEESPYNMNGIGFSVSPGIDFLYKVSNGFGLISSLYFRYAYASDFCYSNTTVRHTTGDRVLFADGSSLTLNLSGLKFLIGIVFNWS